MQFRKGMVLICNPFSLFIAKKTRRMRRRLKLRHLRLENVTKLKYGKLSAKTHI